MAWTQMSEVYDYVHVMLWSGLAALLIFFAVYTLPKFIAFQAKMQAPQVIDLTAENDPLSTSLAISKGMLAHDQCCPLFNNSMLL